MRLIDGLVVLLPVSLFLECCFTPVSAAEWELGPTGSKASFRAVSAPSNQTLWIGGSQGTILRSTDGGNSWQNCSPAGYAEVEFRSLHAWDDQRACAASAGTPAVILLTDDGGQNWSVRYQHKSLQAFFDALVFWSPERGMAVSDPVDGRWLMVETDDAGKTWRELAEVPQVVPGEAAFAASNSSLLVGRAGAAWFGTGGVERPQSRIHRRLAADQAWQSVECPLPSNASSGLFSLAADSASGLLVVVGGDYRPDAQSQLTAAWSDDQGENWQAADTPPPTYRSAVIACPVDVVLYLERGQVLPRFVATGPTGTDYSSDGRHWVNFTEVGFHALTVTEQSIYAVGSEGRFGRLKFNPEQ